MKHTMETDEMGNELESFEVWHVEAACVSANMYPSISAYTSFGMAQDAAKDRRADARNWVCVRVTGPHTHFRPKRNAMKYGPRVAVPADLGLENVS